MGVTERLVDEIKKDYDIPKYRCEIVIDTLLSIFRIEEIVNKCVFNGREEGIEFVSKEFPFRNQNSNKSFNIDYLLLNKEKKTLYLVELKTTKRIDQKQLKKYTTIIEKIKSNKSAKFLLEDFNIIQNATRHQEKYGKYKEKYLKEIEDQRIFDEIDNAILIYILPNTKGLESSCGKNNIKTITFKNLYSMEFDDKDENARWTSIKGIFEFIHEAINGVIKDVNNNDSR